MVNYRVYMSCRRASTGTQVADITLLANVASAQVAEQYVEAFTRGEIEGVAAKIDAAMKQALCHLWGNSDLLFVYMKGK